MIATSEITSTPTFQAAINDVIEAMDRHDPTGIDRHAVAEDILTSWINHGDSQFEVSGFDRVNRCPSVLYLCEAYEKYYAAIMEDIEEDE